MADPMLLRDLLSHEVVEIDEADKGLWCMSDWDIDRLFCDHIDLRHADLRGASLAGFDLSKTDLYQADLRGANLRKVNLRNADLCEADLRNSDLRNADLCKADLRGANLCGAKMVDADLAHANLSDANLEGVNLAGANLWKARLEKAILIGANLEGAGLTDVALLQANLTRAHFTTEGSIGEGGSSFLDLATCRDLNTATFESPGFLPDYLERAFAYAHREETKEAMSWPDYVKSTLEKIRNLRALQSPDEPSPSLVQAIDTVTAELINYLKRHPKKLYEIPPDVFEEIVAEVLASFGWQVDITPKSKDGGYDIFALSPTGDRDTTSSWIIECKRYAPHRKVGVDIVRALYGSNLLSRRDGAAGMKMLATTSRFTAGAQAFKASRYDLALKDYESILDWLNTYRPNPNGRLYLKDNKLVMPGMDGG